MIRGVGGGTLGSGALGRGTVVWYASMAVLTVALALLLLRMGPPSATASEASPVLTTGLPVPDLRLVGPDRAPTQLYRVLGHRPALLLLLDGDDCYSCGDYATELKILERELPDLRSITLGVGPDTAMVRGFLARHRLFGFHVDGEDPRISLGFETPLVLLVDDQARVLLSDARPPGAAKAFPMSRLLQATSATLHRRPRKEGVSP